MSVKVFGARALVKEIKNEKEVNGILIPDRDKQQTNKGVVIAIGDGAMLENGEKVPMKVEVGDTVIYSSFSGSPIKEKGDDDSTYLILNERDILCVIDEE